MTSHRDHHHDHHSASSDADRGTPAVRARRLFADARGLLADVRRIEADSADRGADLYRLATHISRATTRAAAARYGAQFEIARELLREVLEELVGAAEAVGPLDAELVRISDEVVARGAEIADEDAGDDELADVQIVLDTIDQIVRMAFEKGTEMVRIGTLGVARLRDFAEFELLHSQALRDLADKNMDAVDAILPRLSGLAAVLVAPEVTVMYDDVVFRRLIGPVEGGSDQVV